MPNYLRPRIPGASIFFTVNLAARGSDTLTENIGLLRAALAQTLAERPFTIDAWVVLPDHMHAVWTLPAGDDDYATRWRLIKARFSRALPFDLRGPSHVARRERGLWQRRFWEHHLRNASERDRHISYCWNNPVRHGLVGDPFDWPHSSIHRDMARSLAAGQARRDTLPGKTPPMVPAAALSPPSPLS